LRSTNFGFTVFICSRLSASMLCSLRQALRIALRPASNLARRRRDRGSVSVAGMLALENAASGRMAMV